jgi:purine-binding chemotaxis protein CheW
LASEEPRMLQRDALAQRLGTQLSPPGMASRSQSIQFDRSGAEGTALAAVPIEVGDQYLVFSLLEREFAIRAEYLQAVERFTDITPVPNIASWVKGVVNLRGSIASVVDLRAFLGIEGSPYNPLTRLLSVQCNDMAICLIVDGVSEMVLIPDTAVTSPTTRQASIPSWAAPYVSGSALLDKRVIMLLDAARLLFSDKMQHYSTE